MKVSSRSIKTIFNAQGAWLEFDKPPHWSEQAACIPHEALFMSDNIEFQERQRAVCATCNVVAECLEEALRIEGQVGEVRRGTMRGGLTPLERVEVSRESTY